MLPEDVEAILGRPLTEAERGAMLLLEQMARIALATHRPDRAQSSDAFLAGLDQSTLDLVLAEAIALRLRNPEAVKETEIQIDDGRVVKKYSTATGQMTILPDWLDWLGIPRQRSCAFTITPSYR